MTRIGRTALLPVLAALTVTAAATACGGFTDGFSQGLASGLASATPTPTAAAAPTAAPAPAPAAPAPAAPASWVMPDLVGSNLQEAQDAIQALTGFAIPITTSHDATGAGRNQILDRNWKVCDQNIRAGKPITADSKIDFGAVKLTERC